MTTPPALLEALVRARLGSGTWAGAIVRDPATPMTRLIEVAERYISRQVDVVWVDGGPSTMWSYVDLDPPTVVFNTAAVEASSIVRHLIVAETFGLDQEILARQLLSRLLSRICYAVGAPETGFRALVASALGETGVELLGVGDIFSLEENPGTNAYMCQWFFAFAHEFGHVEAKALQDSELWQRWVEHIRNSRCRYADDVQWLSTIAESTLDAWERNNAVHTSIDVDILAVEAHCDVVATKVVFESALRIQRELGLEPDPLGAGGGDERRFCRPSLPSSSFSSLVQIAQGQSRIGGPARGPYHRVAVGVRMEAQLNSLANALTTLGQSMTEIQTDPTFAERKKQVGCRHPQFGCTGQTEAAVIGNTLDELAREILFPELSGWDYLERLQAEVIDGDSPARPPVAIQLEVQRLRSQHHNSDELNALDRFLAGTGATDQSMGRWCSGFLFFPG